ncbi:alpha/beta fold hydrolase [Spirillospora sp. CA-142024]|uniref:alpha/beta fold hydrolase n=1 Tax=Spirillospora sp. CA-142024 TaxID=3240036 RepID=UPI003D8E452A
MRRLDSVLREQVFTPVPGGACLTVVDRPADGPAAATVCIAHGLTGDRVGPAELLAQLSAELCRRARVRVVRFDMRGSGDSGGEFHETTFTGMTDDFAAVAAGHAPAGTPLVCAGISIGGVPAALGAHRLWRQGELQVAGVALMSSDLIEGIRFGTGGVTAIRGGEFHLPEAFFREREALRPRTLLLETGVPYMLVYGRHDAKIAAEAAWFSGHGGEVVEVDSDHLFESGTARAHLLTAWTRFLDHVLRPPGRGNGRPTGPPVAAPPGEGGKR